MYDAIVIGGGPAGSQAARMLAERGYGVVVLEQGAKGRTKCCAGALSGRALGYLHGIQLPPYVDLHTVEISCRGKATTFEAPAAIAKFVVRSQLDELLLEAAEQAGACICYNTPATKIQLADERVIVQTPQGPVEGKYLVGADGATGITRRLAVDKPKRMAIGLEGELFLSARQLAPFEEKAIVDYGCIKDGYGWIFPKVDRLSVGICSFSRKPLPLQKKFQQFLASQALPQPKAQIAHPIPTPSSQRLVVGRALLVGDAAALADPLCGEGIAYALASGQLAAQTIGSALEEGQSLKLYEVLVEEEIRSELAVLEKLRKLVYAWPSLTQAMIRQWGILLEEYFTAIAGKQSYSQLGEKLKRPVGHLLKSGSQ